MHSYVHTFIHTCTHTDIHTCMNRKPVLMHIIYADRCRASRLARRASRVPRVKDKRALRYD